MEGRRAVAALRRPEYTGENRCLPCTAVNLVVVAAASAAAAAWSTLAAGVGVAVVGVALVYARGYVVPGTPTLTQRLLPDRVLAYFEHGGPAADAADDGVDDADRDFDPESALRDAGALTPCADRDDLCLDSVFRTAWRSEMAAAAADLDAAVGRLLPDSVEDPADVEFRGESVVARVSGTTVAQWPSRAAFVADAAGAAALADADPEWPDREFAERTRLLAGLRLWLDRCSVCDGRVELGEETVESCCRSVPVVAASCTSCGARVFEAPLPDDES
ncbi:hypothetical protein [Halobacterium yunchengense]|uniref:hypothetical protein n=1 Tax=Halobacterium yunchengense TaxID=3108497 RepID=UPI003009502A